MTQDPKYLAGSMIGSVIDCINEVLAENGLPTGPLVESTAILTETEMDSLGLAVVLIKLEERTHKDPFKAGFVDFRTIGELAQLYEV